MSLFETLSGLAVRRLSPERLGVLRRGYLGLRQGVMPLIRAVNGTFDAKEIHAHLDRTVGRDFEVLMVHCSVNHLQPAYIEGPQDLLKMLLEYCGPTRTLAMPAFYFGDSRQGGVNLEFAAQPRVNLRRLPSQMGMLSELFRRSKGVLASRHPVMRICATGPLAHELVKGHECALLPHGIGSPFDFMARHDTLILGIGKPFEVLTHVHHAEDLLGAEFPVPARAVPPLDMVLVDGAEDVPFVLRARELCWRRDMWRLRALMTPHTLREWKFHGVPLFATRARDVTASLVAAAREGRTLYVRP